MTRTLLHDPWLCVLAVARNPAGAGPRGHRSRLEHSRLNAIVTVGGQSPPRAFIRLAMVHLAIYDAVNAIEGQPFVSYASKPLVNRPASADAAVAAAAHDILVALFPVRRPISTQSTRRALNALPDDAARANGVAVGQQAAAAILVARANDGRDATVTYIPGSGPGVYVPTPPAFLAALSPETPLVQPFALKSASQFRPDPPPTLDSRLWARDYNEIKALGPLVAAAGRRSRPTSGDSGATTRHSNGSERGGRSRSAIS